MNLKSRLSRLQTQAGAGASSPVPKPSPSTLRERIAQLETRGQSRCSAPTKATPTPHLPAEQLAGTLDGERIADGVIRIHQRLPLDAKLGAIDLDCLREHPRLPGDTPDEQRRHVYIDTETTGLSGGSGTLAFLIGIALWGFTQNPASRHIQPQRKKVIFRKKYWIYYFLTFMAGARRQIFIAFAVFLLVKKFEFSIQEVTVLFVINNVINYFLSPLIGKSIIRFGERKVLSVEYGSAWVAPLIGKLDSIARLFSKDMWRFGQPDLTPGDLVRRNVWVAPFFENDVVALADLIGPGHVLTARTTPIPRVWPSRSSSSTSSTA